MAQGCAVMLGVIYVLNLAYPRELRYFHEVIQKVLMQMDGKRPKEQNQCEYVVDMDLVRHFKHNPIRSFGSVLLQTKGFFVNTVLFEMLCIYIFV